MNKHAKTVSLCLAAAAPALASGTSSPALSFACAAAVLLSGLSSVGAVRLFGRNENPMLNEFAALITAAAVAYGLEMIISAAFPSSFEGAPTFALTGAPLFFAACSAPTYSTGRAALCCTAAASLLVAAVGMVRLLFSLLPLSGDISMGLIFACIITAFIGLVFDDREAELWEV